MTQNKLSFSVENAEMISENPNSSFAVLSLDFFASGENLHKMYVSEETLMRTAESIKNCPLIWRYDNRLDDAHGHGEDQTPCGFVPPTAEIQSRKLPDGRVMLSVVAYVWKRYTGEILKFFKRDGGKKPVSVEMIVHNTRQLANGLLELLDFRYEGITVLGTFVTPAIPLASATVLSFAQIKNEYDEAYRKEFLFSNIDMTIPQEVRDNARKGLSLRKEFGIGETSVGIATAKYLSKNITAKPEKIKQIFNYFSRHKGIDLTETDPPSNQYVSSLLWGGFSGLKWAQSIVEKMDKEEEKRMSLTEGRETLSVEKSEDKEKLMEDIKKEEEITEVEMSEEQKEKELEEEKFEEKESEDEKEESEESKESEEEEKPKFEFPKGFDMTAMSEMFAEDEEDEEVKMAKEELAKGEFANPSIVMGAMFAKMMKMQGAMNRMAEEARTYMEENKALKEFKEQKENEQKLFEVEKTLTELSEKVVIPAEVKEEMKAEAEKYEFSNIDAWKTYCKAKSFDFQAKVEKDDSKSVERVGMPFTAATHKTDDQLWS